MPPSPPQVLPAIVVDFGGVLITPITNQMSDVAASHGVEMLTMLEVLMGPRGHSTPDHPWHRAERGEITTAEMQTLVEPWAARAGITLRGDEYERVLRGHYSVIDEMIECVRDLHDSGHTTSLLTNSFAEFRSTLRELVDFSLFDVVIDSSDVGCRKPEPEIYRIVTDRLGVDASQVVYLDDFLANVDGARDAGWTAVHVVDPLVAIDELRRLVRTWR
jgi:epoxide hydrolase-like predicted phosphatase